MGAGIFFGCNYFLIMIQKITQLFFCVVNRAGMASLFVGMMLQRTPLVRAIADMSFSMAPRTVQLFRILFGVGITVGTVNTVTAATGDLSIDPSSSPLTGDVGDSIQIVLSSEEVSGNGIPKSAEVQGDLPPGISLLFNKDVGVIAFSGTYTAAGVYDITVIAWEDDGFSGDSSNPFNMTFTVMGTGISITTHPVSQVSNWGGSVDLSVGVSDPFGVTYQWQKQDAQNANIFNDIGGQISDTLSLVDLMSANAGVYRVIATEGQTNLVSNEATLSVNVSSYESYQENNFNDPFSAEAGELFDPDSDGYSNIEEHHFGLDPQFPETIQLPVISREMINGVLYIVQTFPSKISDSSLPIVVQENANLASNGWSAASPETLVFDTNQGFVVKIPVLSQHFSRLRF